MKHQAKDADFNFKASLSLINKDSSQQGKYSKNNTKADNLLKGLKIDVLWQTFELCEHSMEPVFL